MSLNRVRYFQEKFDSSFFRMKIDAHRQKAFIAQVAKLFGEETISPPHFFFELEKSVEEYARLSLISDREAQHAILAEPSLLFELNAVPYLKNGKGLATVRKLALPERPRNINYSTSQIERTARAVLLETGFRPKISDAPIDRGEIADGTTTWRMVDKGFRAGIFAQRGVREFSLYDFFDARRITDPVIERLEQPRDAVLYAKAVLTDEDIILSARMTQEATGLRPSSADGVIKFGPLKNIMTWTAVDRAYAQKLRGLVSTHSSLSSALDHAGIPANKINTHNPARPDGLVTLDDIERSARLMIAIAGRRPTRADGTVQFGPLKDKITWKSIEYMLRTGNGLAEPSEQKSIAAFLDSRHVPHPAAPRLRRAPVKSLLCLEDIEESARATLENKGHRPHATDGLVEFGRLAGKEKWILIDQCIRNGERGLRGTGYKGLLDFMNRKSIPEFLGEKPRTPQKIILIGDILDSIKATYEATGRRASKNDGLIEHGALKDRMHWGHVDSNLFTGGCGLDGCGYKSVSQCADALKIPQNAVPRPNKGIVSKPLFLEDIRESVEETYLQTQWWASARNIKVEHGPLAQKETWAAINLAMMHGRRGLVDTGYDGLRTLVQEVKTQFAAANQTVSVRELIRQCANYAKSMPRQLVPQIGPLTAPLAQLDKALREGKISGLETVSEFRPVTNVIDFMLAAGLLEKHGRDIVVAPLPKIDLLAKTFA